MEKASYWGGGLREQGEFSPQIWAISDLQYHRLVSSWSCSVGPLDLIISVPTSFLCDSADLGLHAFLPTNLSEDLLSLFLSYSLFVFLPFSFHLRKNNV